MECNSVTVTHLGEMMEPPAESLIFSAVVETRKIRLRWPISAPSPARLSCLIFGLRLYHPGWHQTPRSPFRSPIIFSIVPGVVTSQKMGIR